MEDQPLALKKINLVSFGFQHSWLLLVCIEGEACQMPGGLGPGWGGGARL